jgi:hypothetical protein
VLVFLANQIALDKEARKQAARNGLPVSNLSATDPAYPLITARTRQAVLQQCVHILNGCPQSAGKPYYHFQDTNYRKTGEMVRQYRYLCSTSRVEALHSASQRFFTGFGQLGSHLFDAKACWMVTNYNRNIRRRHHEKNVLPVDMAPDENPGVAMIRDNRDGLHFGFEYARRVNGLEGLKAYEVLETLAEGKDGDVMPVIPVMPSAPDLLDGSDAEDDGPAPVTAICAPGAFQVLPPEDRDGVSAETESTILRLAHVYLPPLDAVLNTVRDAVLDTVRRAAAPAAPPIIARPRADHADDRADVPAVLRRAAAAAGALVRAAQGIGVDDPSWIDGAGEALDRAHAVTLNTNKNVARKRKHEQDPTTYDPDYNGVMKAVWDRIWVTHRELSTSVKDRVLACLRDYAAEQRKAGGGAALLPTNYARAKMFLDKMDEAQSQSLRNGAVNAAAADIIRETQQALAPMRNARLGPARRYHPNELLAPDVRRELPLRGRGPDPMPGNQSGTATRTCAYCKVAWVRGCLHKPGCPNQAGLAKEQRAEIRNRLKSPGKTGARAAVEAPQGPGDRTGVETKPDVAEQRRPAEKVGVYHMRLLQMPRRHYPPGSAQHSRVVPPGRPPCPENGAGGRLEKQGKGED